MKRILIFACFNFIFFLGYSQSKNVTAKFIKTLPENSIIYLGALWCAPCIEKQNILEDSLKFNKRNFFVFYDKLSFSIKKQEKLLPNSNTSDIFLLDNKYYASGGIIQIESPKKAIKRFYEDLISEGFTIIKEKTLWFGDCIIKEKNNLIIITGSKKEKSLFISTVLSKSKLFQQ